MKLFLDVELDKTFQVADWRIRPLPKGMLDYARYDSHYLIPVYMMVLEMCEKNFMIENCKLLYSSEMSSLEWVKQV